MIVIAYGKEIVKNTYEALTASDIQTYLKSGYSVSIKPNLVVSKPANDGATTHPEVVEGIIRYLLDFGIRDIKIIESSWVGGNTKKAFKNCGYEELSKRYDVPLIDLKSDKHTSITYEDSSIDICNSALNTDFLINVPVLKAHCQTRLTCCMKNLKGCIPDNEKRRFHSIGLHKPIAVLNAILKTGYNVVDGICGDLSFEEGGTPVEANRIIVGRNPLLIDSYCAELIGYRPDEIGYLTFGKALGLGEYFSQETQIVEISPDNKPINSVKGNRLFEKYANAINEDSACSACYSALIYAMHRLGISQTKTKIYIGQGFRGKSEDGVGIGNCTCGFAQYVKGCPPKATDIMEMLGSLGSR